MSQYVIEWEGPDGELIEFRARNKDDVIDLLLIEIVQLTDRPARVRFPDGTWIEG